MRRIQAVVHGSQRTSPYRLHQLASPSVHALAARVGFHGSANSLRSAHQARDALMALVDEQGGRDCVSQRSSCERFT